MAIPKEGKPFYGYGLECWADHGMISVAKLDKAADSNCTADEAFKRIKPIEFLKRAAAVVLYHQREGTPPSERVKAERFMENVEKAVKLAISQGDPTDPSVLEHVIKHDAKSSILVPKMPDVPRKIKCRETPQDTLLSGYHLTPDFGAILQP
jgi:hypothetical protein